MDASPRGVKEWGWDAYNPGGAVQGKATDSAMAAKMSFVARAGHPCGADFLAADFWSTIPNFLAEAAAAGYESGPVDGVCGGSEGSAIAFNNEGTRGARALMVLFFRDRWLHGIFRSIRIVASRPDAPRGPSCGNAHLRQKPLRKESVANEKRNQPNPLRHALSPP